MLNSNWMQFNNFNLRHYFIFRTNFPNIMVFTLSVLLFLNKTSRCIYHEKFFSSVHEGNLGSDMHEVLFHNQFGGYFYQTIIIKSLLPRSRVHTTRLLCVQNIKIILMKSHFTVKMFSLQEKAGFLNYFETHRKL